MSVTVRTRPQTTADDRGGDANTFQIYRGTCMETESYD
jgi:hypothetical protein